MAKITISELRPAGVELFDGSESYLQELTDTELNGTKGGITPVVFVAGVGVGILISSRYCG
jgi:hypothetical protein